MNLRTLEIHLMVLAALLIEPVYMMIAGPGKMKRWLSKTPQWS
jgi:hypothetical protein